MSKQLQHVTLATKLSAVVAKRKEIENLLKPLEKEEDELRGQLLENLKRQGVRSVKLDDDTMYVRALKTTLKVSDEHDAVLWGIEHNCIKPDTSKAWKILKLTGETDKLPECFERQDTEYLTERTVNEK